ncbi:serine hydrolase [Halobacteriovorax sp. HLS]|uniref:serine hydrolase domain-containing protein n=1 Tax=Halobacteriovorax sp. HLS TaxID=2234000 RepID=UPI0013E29AD3|nr:serine hydrolase [Halobacteriovorax sp. HLS]
MLEYAFDTKAGYKTDGLVVIHKGHIVVENYANGYNRESLHLLWSISKSVTSLLTGILIKEGRVSLDDKISEYYPGLGEVSVKNLLQMSSGIAWNEGYENNPLDSNVIQMLYTSGHKDMASYTSKVKIGSPPNTTFKYSSGETNLLMGFIKNRIAHSDNYANLPWEKIFTPLGISEAVWERDLSGTFVGSSYLYLRPLDLAKIGQLYLQNGSFNDNEIISSKWVNFSRSMAPAFEQTYLEGTANGESYGAMWWLNLPSLSKKTTRPYPSAPKDLYMALGHHGQMLAIIPSLDLIVVRTAEDKSQALDKDYLFKLLINSLEK